MAMPKQKLPWFKKRLPVFTRTPPELALTDEQYSAIEIAGELKLDESARGKLLVLLRRYQIDKCAWESAARLGEVREILEPLRAAAGRLSKRLSRLLAVRDAAQDATLSELLVHAPGPEPTTPRWYGAEYPGNDWQTWLNDTLRRVTVLESWAQWTRERLPQDTTGGREANEFLHGLLGSLREFFRDNGGEDSSRFGRRQREHFLHFVEAAVSCIPGHSQKDLTKTISRALPTRVRRTKPTKKS